MNIRAWLTPSYWFGARLPELTDSQSETTTEKGTSAVAAGMTVNPEYPANSAMSALAAYPWVRACVEAKAYDLARLPLYIIKKDADGTETEVRDHPLVLRLRAPNRSSNGLQLRAQLVADLSLSANAYLYHPYGAHGPIYRLHPSHCKPVVSDALEIVAYEYGGKRISPSEITHFRYLSWADDARGVLGESVIRTLHTDLVASLNAKKFAAKAASRGRPEFMVSPTSPDTILADSTISLIQQAIEDQVQSGKAALVSGEALSVTPLSMTMRDIEYSELQTSTTAAVLAVLGVPGDRVGLPGANYGTSRTQHRIYWENLMALAAIIDEGLSGILGDPQLSVKHDFASVEVLQVSYSERMARVQAWVSLGADPHAAAQYEGFRAPPLRPGVAPPSSSASPASSSEERPDEPQGAGSRRGDVAGWLRGASGRYARDVAWYRSDLSRVSRLASELEAARDQGIPESLVRFVDGVVSQHLAECIEQGTEPYIRGLSVFQADFARAWSEHAA